MNNLIRDACHIPVPEAVQTVSTNSVIVPVAGRGLPLDMRIIAPVAGTGLPVLLLSHDHGPSLYIPSKEGYAPLAHFFAELVSSSSSLPMPIPASPASMLPCPEGRCSGARASTI